MHGRIPALRLRAGAANFLLLARGYWRGKTAIEAWLLTTVVAAMLLSSVAVQSRINSWNAAFFDALERRQATLLGSLLWDFAFYVAAAGVVMVTLVLFRMALQVCLRKWLSKRVMGRWLTDGTYLRLVRRTRGSETPEFRIADDIRLAVDPLVDLSVGLAGSVLIAVTFFAVLAAVGGSLEIASLGLTIPAYFLFGAVFYALVMSGIASLAGWPLIRRIEAKNHREGVFRYELTRFRESAAQGGAARDGVEGTRGLLFGALDEVARSWRGVVIGQARVSGVASANAVLVGVFPVMLAVPKYITGEMTLGAVMQLATAFVQVQMALNWIVDNFYRFAEWRASANRVGDFLAAMEMVGDDHISSGAASPCLGTMAGMIETRPVEAATSGEAEAPLVPGLSPTP